MTDLGAVAIAGGAGICSSAALLAYAVRAPRSSLLAPSVYHGERSRPAIALTFDDGPSESTPELLEILARHQAPATFFQCGANVRRLPGIARQVAEAGHEIGNHSDTHPMLHFKSRGFIRSELARAQDAIFEATGARPRYFRAPFGVRWFGLRASQRELDLVGVMWSTIARDWKRPSEELIPAVLHGAENGAIICLHDGRLLAARPHIGATLETVRQVLPKLRERGFHFEKVSEILCPTKS